MTLLCKLPRQDTLSKENFRPWILLGKLDHVSDLAEKESALRKVLAFYQDSEYAITAKRLDHQRLDTFPYSKSFRRKFPLFNATIWAYHYLQVVVYDALEAALELHSDRTDRIAEHFYIPIT